MPIFEYTCLKCGMEQERIVPSHKVVPPCLFCSSPEMDRRKVHKANFALKGSGWARDGYGGKK